VSATCPQFRLKNFIVTLNRLIEEAPTFGGTSSVTAQQLIWVGRAEALIQASGDAIAGTEFSVAKAGLVNNNVRVRRSEQ
jgi:hypothetical protein